jgi:LysR family transcriptional activator of nhaA
MEWLNYHHLLYFWTVAREGSVTRAAAALNVTQPAISRQLQQLEQNFGHELFVRSGRRLVLTDSGKVALEYAEEIFSLGKELGDVMKGRSPASRHRFSVGLTDAVPKLVAHQLLEPAFAPSLRLRVTVTEDEPSRLLAALAVHELDLVITDAPFSRGTRSKVSQHLLAESGTSFFAEAALARSLRHRFPHSLSGGALMLPSERSELRRAIDHWLESNELRPAITGEFDDSALMNAVASEAQAVFPGPTVIEEEICRQYGVAVAGRVDELRERYYALSPDRRLKHPAVLAITSAAQRAFPRKVTPSSSKKAAPRKRSTQIR